MSVPTPREAHVEAVYRLSPVQEGILFQSLREGRARPYWQQATYHVDGVLDRAAFARAWQAVIARHTILRTAFVWQQTSTPYQAVMATATPSIEWWDWRGLDADEQQRRSTEYLARDRERGGDLLRPPLMRFAVMQQTDTSHRVVWSHHHLVIDGWSSSLVLKEASAYYAAFSRNEALELPAAPPYEDYIRWLQQRERGGAEAYWRRALAGFEGLPPLIAGARGTITAETVDQRRTVPEATTRRLREVAARHRLTLNTIAQGCWGLVMARAVGARDVVFGATVSGRSPELPGIERLVGLLINTLPVRVRVTPREPVIAWLRQLQDEQASAREWEHTALTDIQGWSAVPRGTPLFESVLVYENFPGLVFEQHYGSAALAIADTSGVQRNVYLGTIETSEYPLAFKVVPGDALVLRLMRHRGRIDETVTARMLDYAAAMLDAIATRSDLLVGDLASLPAERTSTAPSVEWSAAPSEAVAVAPVPSRIATWASRAPARIAMRSGTTTVSYETLHARASTVGRELQQLGVARETRVGIFLPRSIEFVVACLGVWNAGGAYVPLDPVWPTARVSQVMDDAGVSVIVTDRVRADQVPTSWAQVLTMETCEPAEPAADPAAGDVAWPSALPTQAAYVLYTSGSSGRPKGVVVPHAALSQYVTWAIDTYDVAALPWSPWHTSPSFDLSVTSLWVPLAAGQCVEALSGETGLDALTVMGALLQAGASGLVKLTPAHLRALRTTWGEAGLPPGPGRTVVVGGEALSYGDIAGWAGIAGVRVINEYGPTEATVGCCIAEVGASGASAAAPTAEAPVPIGRPIAGATLYVVDARGARLPEGAAGELWIGGAGVARGYLGCAALTAASFVPDPWGPPGTRVYRSGDRVRQRADGQLEYLGRRDGQVKIRGYRVEPGEIEQLLRTHPAVAESAVVVRHTADGSGQLIAYISPRPTAASASSPALAAGLGDMPDAATRDGAAVRRWLAERLPEYMVPTVVVVLDRLPVTANGKLDRQALPAPMMTTREAAEDAEAPQAPLLQTVCAVWADVLQVAEVDPAANFFELGGHSLLATQIIARLQALLGIEITLEMLIATPTAAAFAAAIVDQLHVAPAMAGPGWVRADRNRPLRLSYGQQRLWFLDQLNGGGPTYNLPIPVRLDGDLDVAALQRALSTVVARHEILRTSYPVHDGQPVQQIAEPASMPLRTIDVSALADAQQTTFVRDTTRALGLAPFDLRQGPVLRAFLLRLDRRRHLLLVVVHHIASDGWSVGLLGREVRVTYEAFVAGRPCPLPDLPLQYADYAHWQHQALQDDRLRRHLDYWRTHLAGVPPLDLGTLRDSARTGTGTTMPYVLPPTLVSAIEQFSRREGVTPFVTFMAAYQLLLSRIYGQSRFIVGTPLTSRPHLELEPLIGFFINLIALRADLTDVLTIRDLLRRILRAVIGAHAHQDVPFERIVGALQPDRRGGQVPLVNAVLAYERMNTALAPIAPEAGPSRFTIALDTVKFALALWMTHAPGQLLLAWRFDHAVLTRGTVEDLHRTYVALLDAMTSAPRSLDELWQRATAEPLARIPADAPQFGHAHATRLGIAARRRPVSSAPLGKDI
jgi:amino acid adenylation domain-containing protein